MERVHAEENRVLSSHGPFSCKMVHTNYAYGSDQHRENIEAMASEVTSHTVGHHLVEFLGSHFSVTEVLQSLYVFDDDVIYTTSFL